jgi:hypothetical protein
MKEEMLKFVSDLINRDDVESIHYGGYDEWANSRILASIIKEKIENYIKYCDEYLKNSVENPTLWENKEFGKSLELSIKKSSTLDSKIVDELTDAECRKGFTVTEKAIKLCGRGDLINKYKSITESKAITLKNLKD